MTARHISVAMNDKPCYQCGNQSSGRSMLVRSVISPVDHEEYICEPCYQKMFTIPKIMDSIDREDLAVALWKRQVAPLDSCVRMAPLILSALRKVLNDNAKDAPS